MYTTKEGHRWAKVGFLSSKEPYMDSVTLDRKTLDRRFKGLQFKTNPPKSGRAGLFTSWSYEASPPISYASRRKKMKKATGFGSSDLADRGEFGNQERQSQWAEWIKKEHSAKLNRAKTVPDLNCNQTEHQKESKENEKRKKKESKDDSKQSKLYRFQYDIAHDTMYKPRSKRPVTADPRQSSYVYLQSAQSVKNLSKSKFARRSLMMDQFYSNNRGLSISHHIHGRACSNALA